MLSLYAPIRFTNFKLKLRCQVQVGLLSSLILQRQAPAQAQNIRDSLEEAGENGIKVAIGLREGSPSWEEAEACGFSKVDGTLGEVFDIIAQSDFVILLISDAAQVTGYRPNAGLQIHFIFKSFDRRSLLATL